MTYDKKQNIYFIQLEERKLSTTYVAPEGPDRGTPPDLLAGPSRTPDHKRHKSHWEILFKEIGTNVRNQREDQGWTPSNLARKAGISEETLEKLESGKKCSINTLLRIAGTLRMDIVIPGIPVYPTAEQS